MVTAGLVASKSCVGPSSFLSVSVARMNTILPLSRTPYIGHSVRSRRPLPLPGRGDHLGLYGTRDLQHFRAVRGALQAVHTAACGPDQRGAGEQRPILVHPALRTLVEIHVIAHDDRARPPADLHTLGSR